MCSAVILMLSSIPKSECWYKCLYTAKNKQTIKNGSKHISMTLAVPAEVSGSYVIFQKENTKK